MIVYAFLKVSLSMTFALMSFSLCANGQIVLC